MVPALLPPTPEMSPTGYPPHRAFPSLCTTRRPSTAPRKRRPAVADGFFHLPRYLVQLAFEHFDLCVHLFLCHTTDAKLTLYSWCGHYIRTARTNATCEFCHAHPSLAGFVCFFTRSSI